jgi:hypothetical protein
MFLILLRRHKTMILISIFFFYIGCGITLSYLRLDCAEAVSPIPETVLSVYDPVEYAVLVLTGPDNEGRRDTIRATWAKFATNIFIENGETLYKWNHTWVGEPKQQDIVKIYFSIGTRGLSSEKMVKLKNEAQKSNDILFLDFEDGYNNLAAKILHSMKWFQENLKKLKYVVKCDDDSFVRIDLIVKDLEAFAPDMSAQSLIEYVTFKVCQQQLNIYFKLMFSYIIKV